MTVSIRRFNSCDTDFAAKLDALRAFESAQNSQTDETVKNILAAVRARGDAALLEFTQRFDRWQPDAANPLEISRGALASALVTLAPGIRAALHPAATPLRTAPEHPIQPP